MPHNETHEELAALAALSALDGPDAASFEAHLQAGCSRCEQILGDLRIASTALAATARPVPPRAGLRAEILASLDEPAAKVVPIAPRRSGAAVPWLLAAAASLLVLFLGLDDARLRREREELASRSTQLAARLLDSEKEVARRDLRVKVLESEDVRILFLSGQAPQPGARAKVFWSEKAKRGVLLAGNLQPLPADKQYELWVFDQGKPVAAGVFDVDAEGRVLFESPDLSAIASAQNFAVTVEPRGGVAAPTGPIVLVGTPS
jgi:hypothetical protein